MSFTDHHVERVVAQPSRTQLSTGEWESLIGKDFRALRLLSQFDQASLADLAGVSLGALKNLENGRGSTLKTIVGVATALGRESWLESLSPTITVSPISVLRSGTGGRQRVFRPRRKKK
jgi:transcriptional regulator with XRE-family HTH domain